MLSSMNIFVVNSNPRKAAQDMCDKHIVKMILETAQMLCSAHPEGTATYKPTHRKHPCTLWASASIANYNWLCLHGLALCDEYTKRYGKIHKSEDIIRWCHANYPPNIPIKELTPFAQAMPEQYKDVDAVVAYRKYYIAEKSRFAAWKNSTTPLWFSSKNPYLDLESTR